VWPKLVADESKQAACRELKENQGNMIAYKLQLPFVYREAAFFISFCLFQHKSPHNKRFSIQDV
jgi:hypothetical protein